MELSMVIPTYNEKENIRTLYERLRRVLEGIDWEIIFVDDDSPDGTAGAVSEVARQDRRVRCLKRIGRRGLSSACIEGMAVSRAEFLGVMDADLQHDETIIPAMVEALKEEDCDVAVGSRYVEGGGAQGLSAPRAWISRTATWLGRRISRTGIKDPMSGFFVVRREFFEACRPGLSGRGYKILLDLCASSPGPVRLKEIPYKFRGRHCGRSKLSARVVWDHVLLMWEKAFQRR